MARGRKSIFPAFWRNSGDRDGRGRGKGNGRGTPSGSRRKILFEPLEPRILLSADLLTEGVAGAMSDGIDQFGAVVNEFMLTDTLLNTQLPLVVLSGGDNLLNDFRQAPTIRDLLSVDADINRDGVIGHNENTPDKIADAELELIQFDRDNPGDEGYGIVDFMEIFDGQFIQKVSDGVAGKNDGQFILYLDNLDQVQKGLTPQESTDFAARFFNLQVDSVSRISPTDSQVVFQLDFTLTFTNELALDLGFTAEDMGILFPETTLMVDATVSFTLQFGVLTAGEAVDNEDFFISVPDPMAIEVAPRDTGLDGEVNIGFLGADVNDGSVALEANIEAVFKDPTDSDSRISYSDLTDFSVSSLVDAEPRGVTFDGFSDVTPLAGKLVIIVQKRDELVEDAPITYSSGTGERIGNLEDGSLYYIHSTLDIPGDPSLIGIKLKENPDSTAAISYGGKGTGSDHRLILSNFDANLPIQVLPGLVDGNSSPFQPTATITFDTPTHNPFHAATAVYEDNGDALFREEDSDARFDLRIKLTDISGGYTEDDFLNFANVDASSVIGIFREFGRYLDSLGDSEDFTAYDIPFAAADLGDLLDFRDMWDDALLFDDLDGAADAGPIGFTNREFGEGDSDKGGEIVAGEEPGILGSRDPAVISFVLEVGDSGPTVVSVLTTPGDDIDEQLTLSGLVADLNLAFDDLSVAVTAGEKGVYVKLTADNTGEDVRISPGIRKLVDEDNAPRFSTAQELAARLGEILHPDLTAGEQLAAIGAAYDTGTADLTFNVSLENALPWIEAGADFNLPLDPLDDISSSSKVLLGATAGLDMVLGINLLDSGPDEYLQPTTTLEELGVEVKTDPAVTGENDVRTIYGRLAEDATFDVIVDSIPYEVVVSHSSTDDNLLADDLIEDIRDALAAARQVTGTDASGAREYGDTVDLIGEFGLSAFNEGGRIRLTSTTNDFSVAVTAGDPAMNKLGFRAEHQAEPDDPDNPAPPYSLSTTKDVPRLVGKLTDDAVLTVEIGGVGYTVTVEAGEAEANQTVLDLVNDVNSALSTPSLVSGPVSDFVLTAEATFEVSVNGGSPVSVEISPEDTDGTAAPIVFDGQTAVDLEKDTLTVGNHLFDTGEAVIYTAAGGAVIGGLEEGGSYFISVVDDTTVRLAETAQKAQSGDTIDLLSEGSSGDHSLIETPNADIEDLVQDINRAIAATDPDGIDLDRYITAESYVWNGQSRIRIRAVTNPDDPVQDFRLTVDAGDAAETVLGLPNDRLCGNLENLVEADSQGNHLVLTSLTGSGFTVHAASATELGLSSFQTSDSDDLVIHLSDGSDHRVSLDGAVDVGDVIDRINAVSGDISVRVNDAETGLELRDGTWDESNSRLFFVEPINNSPAATQLGISRVDVTRDANQDGDVNNADADGVIDGAPIKAPRLADRFTLEDASLRAEFSLMTPQMDEDGVPGDTDGDGDPWDGIDATATLGYVGVSLHGGGTLSGEVLTTLDSGGNRGIDSITNSRPVLTGLVDDGYGQLILDVDTERPLSDMVTGALDPPDPRIALTVDDLGDPFHEEPFTDAALTAADRIRVPGDQTHWFTRGATITIEAEPGVTLPAEVLGSSHDSGATAVTLRSGVLERYLGHLSGDAAFTITVDGDGPVDVTVAKDDTGDNDSLYDLAADINAALKKTEIGDRIRAEIVDDRIVLKADDPSVTGFTLTAIDTDPAVLELGFDPFQSSTTDGTAVSLEAARAWSLVLAGIVAAIPPHISVTSPGQSDLSGLGDLLLFDDLDYDDVLNALAELSSFLEGFEAFGDLGDPLLLFDRSVTDLMGLADRFDEALGKAEANPAWTLQILEAKLMEAFGFPADQLFTTDGDGFRVAEHTVFTLDGDRTAEIEIGSRVHSQTGTVRIVDAIHVEALFDSDDGLTGIDESGFALDGDHRDTFLPGVKVAFGENRARVEDVSYDDVSLTTQVTLVGDDLPSSLSQVTLSYTRVSVSGSALEVDLSQVTVLRDFLFTDVDDGLEVNGDNADTFTLAGDRTDRIALGAKVLVGGDDTRVTDVGFVENTFTGSDELSRESDSGFTLAGDRTAEIPAGAEAVFDGGQARVATVDYDAGADITRVTLTGDDLPDDLYDVTVSFTEVAVFDPILSPGLSALTVANDFIDLSLDRDSDPERPALRFEMGLATEFSDVLDAALLDVNLPDLIPDVNLADLGRRGEVEFSHDRHGLTVDQSGGSFILDGDQSALVGPGSKVLFPTGEVRVTDVGYDSFTYDGTAGLIRLDGQRFSVSGDRTGEIAPGAKAMFDGGESRVADAQYDGGTDTTTVILDDPVLPEDLVEVTVSYTTVTVADSVLPGDLTELTVSFMLTTADFGLAWDSGTAFTLSGDQRGLIAEGYRLSFEDGSLIRDTRVQSVVYDIGTEITTVTVSADADLPPSLTEVAVSDEYADLRASGVLPAGGGMVLNLDFGIDLGHPGVEDDAGEVYLYGDTVIDGALSTPFNGVDHTVRDLDFRANLGPFSLDISDGSASAVVTFGANTEFAGRRTVGDVDLSEGSPDVASSLDQTAKAEFPASFNSLDIGTFSFSSNPGLTLPGGFRPDFVEEYTEEKTNLFDNILLAVDGLDLFLAGLQDLLDGEVFGFRLPLIGDQLADGARFIEDLRYDFVDPFRGIIETADEVVTDFEDPDRNIVSGFLFDLLGPAGIDLLLPLEEDGDPQTVGDYVALESDFSSIPDSFIQWNMTIGGTLWNPSAGIGFDIGLPGLNLQTEGSIELEIAWELAFGFGISFSEGFYLDISDGDELELNVEVTLPDAALIGTLGFLRFKAEDKDVDGDGDSTHLSAKFGINIINQADRELIAHKDELPPGEDINDYLDQHLTLPELFGQLSLDFVLGFEAAAELGLTLEVSGDLIGEDTAAGFPSITADFIADFELDISLTELLSKDKDDGKDKDKKKENAFVKTIKESLKVVEFQHVSLDLGSYVSDVLGPVVDKIQDVTEPIQPVIDILTEPIPVISDLGPDLTLLDIAAMAGRVDKRLLYAIADVITLINSIPDPASAESLLLDFGNYTIYDKETMEKAELWSDRFDIGKSTEDFLNDPRAIENLFSDFDSAMNNNTPRGGGKKTKGVLNKMRSAGDFSFPIFDDPAQVFGLLTGRPAVLITYDMDPLTFEFEWGQFFSVYGPLGVSINMEFYATIDFAFGYDTLGIQEFVESDFRDPLLLLDGFYVSDTDLATGDFGT
ncbi:MAG: LEPR-XLL domain-containing protein, partial [bacterium]